MLKTRRHWTLNLLIVLAVLGSMGVFVLHSKNWTRLREDRILIISGFYQQEVPYSELDSVLWKERIPRMERNHGFSYWAREKGVFVDSLHPQRPVYVFVDDLRQHKIKIRYRDTMVLFLNFADSLETQSMYEVLKDEWVQKSAE
ncbi:MAG: hypothetical protein EP302_05415 [Bacteroidetes bacterium]|jgi:hypothetical protein|nr:MAG: hypothetical protein EP302_05415 [Bacteroidota bacterium]UCE70444.1 MAG: hypothetical protein JSW57_06045 [Flavobacteriaceae bacterium]